MKKDKQSIKCDVYNCKFCDLENNFCSLKEIKVSNSSNNKEKDKYKTYSLIASTLILLGGLILLYNAIFDNTIEEEIALE